MTEETETEKNVSKTTSLICSANQQINRSINQPINQSMDRFICTAAQTCIEQCNSACVARQTNDNNTLYTRIFNNTTAMQTERSDDSHFEQRFV